MDFFRKQLERYRTEVTGLLEKLSLSQKISIGLLAVIVVLAMVLVVNSTVSEDFVRVRAPEDPSELAELRALLASEGVTFQEDTTESGVRVLLVPRKDSHRAHWAALQSGDISHNYTRWLYEEPSLVETSARMNQRLLDSRMRSVEDTISSSEKIRATRIELQKGPEPLYATSSNMSDTASVHVLLKPHVDKLSTREASAIRMVVNGAFNIPQQNIQITDNHLNNYSHLESSNGQSLTEEENRLQTEVLRTLQAIYGRIFLPSEFVIGVLVHVSQRKSEIFQESYDPEKVVSVKSEVDEEVETSNRSPGEAPGVAANAGAGGLGSTVPVSARIETETRQKTKTLYDTALSVERVKTDIPRGELKGLSVNLVLDRGAVLRKLREEGEHVPDQPGEAATAQEKSQWRAQMKSLVKQYEDKHRAIIQEQLPLPQGDEIVNVHVSTVSFPEPQAPREVAFAEGMTGWVSEHWKDISLAAIVLVGLIVFLTIIRRSVPAPIEIPSLEDRVLLEDDELHRKTVEELRQQMNTLFREEEVLADDISRGELEENLGKVNEMTRGRPESVAAVLRSWLSAPGPGEEKKRE